MSKLVNQRVTPFLQVCYNEYLSYWVSHVSWPRLPSLDTVPGAQVTMLMVADPQIVGNIHEPSGVLGSVQRWDCDRQGDLERGRNR